jgi:pimeloyl-ACP methyl ester carboxylesterase
MPARRDRDRPVTAEAPETARVQVAGRNLEVLDLPGAHDRAPLVLLHEGLGSVALWHRFPALLAAATDRRVIAFSRFGHGRSQTPATPRNRAFFHEEALEVLPALLREASAERPVLIGHSDGGSIALIAGGVLPVTGIVVLAAHVFVEEVTVTEVRRARAAFVDGDLRARMSRHHDDPDAAFWGWCDVWLDPAFRAWSLDADAARITAPTLVIQGADDPYGSLEQADRIVDVIGRSAERLIVPGGHSPHLERPDEIVAAIADFALPLA